MISNLIDNLKQQDKYVLFIYVYIFLMPWNFLKGQMGALTVILFIWWILKFRGSLVEKLKTMLDSKPLLILIAFVLYTYIAVLWSDPISDGLKHVNKFSKYYLFLIPILFTSLNKEQAWNGIKIFLISFGTYALFSLMIFVGFFTIESTGSDSSNPKGIMAYAIMSAFLAVGAICSFFVGLYQKKVNLKVLFYGIALICFIVLFLNKSRTAQLSLILTIITLSIIYLKSIDFTKKNFYKVVTILVVFLGISFMTLKAINGFGKYQESYQQMKQVIYADRHEWGSLSLRVYFYKAGYEIIQDNFLFGMGPEDNCRELENIQKNDPAYTYSKYFTSFHSQHLDILTRYGFIGYFLLFSSIVVLLWKLRENKQVFYTALSFMLIVFYTSLANVMLIKKPFNYIFISIFVLLSVIAYFDNKQKKDKIDTAQ